MLKENVFSNFKLMSTVPNKVERASLWIYDRGHQVPSSVRMLVRRKFPAKTSAAARIKLTSSLMFLSPGKLGLLEEAGSTSTKYSPLSWTEVQNVPSLSGTLAAA